jgi:CheY-like chemotaxis protein
MQPAQPFRPLPPAASHASSDLWSVGGAARRMSGGDDKRRRLLVADDDATLRGGVVDLLASLQLEILEADTGPAALAIARGSRLHAALLDLHMPGRDLPRLGGLEVLAALRQFGVSLPCILYSADLTPSLEERAREAGALCVLHKPVDPVLLRAEIERALASAPRDG